MFDRLLHIVVLLILPALAFGEEARIGLVLPLTGPLATVGRDIQDAVVLEKPTGVELLFEDDAFEPQKTLATVQKIITGHEARALILFGSGTSVAARPLIERNRIPAIAIAMSDSVVAGAKYLFRHYVPAGSQTELIVKELDSRGYESVVVVASQQEALQAFQDQFRQKRPNLIRGSFEVIPGHTDLKGIAARVARIDP